MPSTLIQFFRSTKNELGYGQRKKEICSYISKIQMVVELQGEDAVIKHIKYAI